MSNALIAYQNRADECALSGGAWSAGLPLSNLQTRVQSNVARSANASPAASQFYCTLPKSRSIGVLALCRHSLSRDAAYRIRAYRDGALTDLAYDSGVLAVWPSVFASLDLEWGADNWWVGKFLAEDLVGYSWNLIHVLRSATYARYWRVELIDETNPAGCVQAGRLFLSDGWQPAYNMRYGASLAYEARTQIEEAWDGTEYFDERAPYRVARFDLGFLSESEAMGRAFEIQRIAGISKEMLFVWNPADTTHLIRRSFLGRARQLNAIEQPYPTIHQTSFEIKELL